MVRSDAPTVSQLRDFGIARSLGVPGSLSDAVARLGFVQADPMRAPARAQDLILMHRVTNYQAGDLERHYSRLPIEEVFFFNYGFLPRSSVVTLHPRGVPADWDADMRKRAREVLSFVRRRDECRAKEVQAHFNHGSIKRWGSALNLSKHALEGLHYAGLLRVKRRDSGSRVYEMVKVAPPQKEHAKARLERAGRLLDMIMELYAPVSSGSFRYLCGLLLRYGTPNLSTEVHNIREQAARRYASACVDGVEWFWPRGEQPKAYRDSLDDKLRFLAPFDPIVWDRQRFQHFFGWEYKLESYVPPAKRRMGHYAMPMLWRGEMIGWANLKVTGGKLVHEVGFAASKRRDRAFRSALDEALAGTERFLGL